VRSFGVIALAGLYFVAPLIFLGLIGLTVVYGTIHLLRPVKFSLKWGLGVVAAGVVVIAVFFVSLQFLTQMSSKDVAPMTLPADESFYKNENENARRFSSNVYEEDQLGQRTGQVQQEQQQTQALNLPSAYLSGSSVVKGVTPVALPMPHYDKALGIDRELVTQERPLAPTLIYLTRNAMYPLLLLWLIALVYIALHLRPRFHTAAQNLNAYFKKNQNHHNHNSETPTTDDSQEKS